MTFSVTDLGEGTRSLPVSSQPVKAPNRSFDVCAHSWILSFLLHGLALEPWQIGLTCFGGYYVLPLIAAAYRGALISPVAARAQFNPIGLPQLGAWLSQSSNVTMYYATDTVHLVMSLMVLCGSTLLFYTLRDLAYVVEDLFESRKLSVNPSEADKVFRNAGMRYRARIWRSALLIVSVSLAVVIERKTHDITLLGWWGHASHGIAGHLLAAAVGLMVLFGGAWLYLLSVGLSALSDLLDRPVRIEPFHPDGCNGFAKFGNYLMMLFVLSAVIAATAWLCLWKGYLGVERLAVTWMAGLGGILAIPIILITPLLRCTRRIAAARLERLRGLQILFERELKQLEDDSATATDPARLSERVRQLRDTQEAAIALYPSNVFPFKPKIAGTLSATYVLQVALFLKEAYDKLIA